MSDADKNLSGVPLPAEPEDARSQFARYLVDRLFAAELSLDSARSIVGDGPAGDRIEAAASEIGAVIREIRMTTFGRVADRPAALQMRIAHTARALQLRALDTAALLEQHAEEARSPGRTDYPTEVKRWKAFAEQAEQIARRWEPPPD